MRPGAAVRLKGTWYNTADKKKGTAGEPSVSASFPSLKQAAHDCAGMSQDVDGPQTLQELQVKEVDILGNSDPQVSRLRSIQGLQVPN